MTGSDVEAKASTYLRSNPKSSGAESPGLKRVLKKSVRLQSVYLSG
jgi:hypothetical protein